MLSENKLTSNFEKEIWLFLDKTLSDERMNFWEEKLNKSEYLREYFDQTFNSLKHYSELSDFDLDDKKFSKMIDIATNKKSIWQRITNFVESIIRKKSLQPYYGKLVLAFAILVTVVTTFLLTQHPFRKLNQNNTPLDWNAKSITAQMNDIKTSIINLELKENGKSIINNYVTNEWNYDYFQIKSILRILETDILNNNNRI